MTYITKDSGKRTEYPDGMIRDAGRDEKVNFLLVLNDGVPLEEQMLTRFAALLTRGAMKYSKRNFERACSQEALEGFKESAFRHMMQWLAGHDPSEDHAAAVWFNVMGAELCKFNIQRSEHENHKGAV
jgi:hypothetical protein